MHSANKISQRHHRKRWVFEGLQRDGAWFFIVKGVIRRERNRVNLGSIPGRGYQKYAQCDKSKDAETPAEILRQGLSNRGSNQCTNRASSGHNTEDRASHLWGDAAGGNGHRHGRTGAGQGQADQKTCADQNCKEAMGGRKQDQPNNIEH